MTLSSVNCTCGSLSTGTKVLTNGVLFVVALESKSISWCQSISSSVISNANALTDGMKLNLSICKAFRKSAAVPPPDAISPVNPERSNNPPGAESIPSENENASLSALVPSTSTPKTEIEISLTDAVTPAAGVILILTSITAVKGPAGAVKLSLITVKPLVT